MVMQIGPMLWGSIQISLLGVILAVPMAISIAYFIVFMANKKFASGVSILVDLLAALPSVVLGLWGLLVFSPVAAGWAKLLHDTLGFLPFFANEDGNFLRSPFIAGWVVAVMIVPIIASVTREIFSQMDAGLINGALALGGGPVAPVKDPSLERAFADVVIVDATRTSRIDLGNRVVELMPLRGHTASDLAIVDQDAGITFAGDLLWNGMFPNFVDATPSQLIASMTQLSSRSRHAFVPGHGGMASLLTTPRAPRACGNISGSNSARPASMVISFINCSA